MTFVVFIFLALLASVYIYPIFLGLILLPLDLLVSNSAPWQYANTILLKNPFMQDSIVQMYPWHRLTFQSLTHGIVPLWNPYQFMGMPFMANMKSMIFYPANIFFVFGEVTSWNILLWFQLFLSLWFFYLLAREFHIDVFACLLGSIAYAFSSFMVGVLEFGSEGHVLLWLPLILFLIKRYVSRKQSRYLIALTAGVASAIFAGQLQYFGIECLVILGFIIFISFQEKPSWRVMGNIAIASVLGLGITAIQLGPLLELFRFSNRGLAGNYDIFNGGLSYLYSSLRLFSPDWFGNPVTHDLRDGYIEVAGYFGIIPLFFAFYAGWFGRKNAYIRFFSFTGILMLLLSLRGAGNIVSLIRIPIITSGAGGRLFTMVLFSGAVLSAFGFGLFMREVDVKKRIRAIATYAICLIVIYTIGLVSNRYELPFGVLYSNMRFPAIIALAGIVSMYLYLRFSKYKPGKILLIIMLVGLTYLDLFRMGYRFLTFSNPKFLYPDIAAISFIRKESQKTLDRVFGLSDSEIYTALGVHSIESYNPLYLKRNGLLMQALEDKRNSILPRYKYFVERNERMKYAADFLGVSLVSAGRDVNPAVTYLNTQSPTIQNDFVRIFQDDRNAVYRDVSAIPRFGLYYRAHGRVSDEEALSALEKKMIDFRTTLLISEALPVDLREGTGSARLVSSTVNSQKYRIETTVPALLYISDTYFPGWRATVNGKKTVIYRANYNFRAVLVPAGKSEVTFDYLPDSVIWGGAVSAMSVVLFLAFCFWQFRLRERLNDKVNRGKE